MDVTRITVGEVRERLARGEPLAIVDARSAEAWGKAETQIPGSIRVPPVGRPSGVRPIGLR